MKKLIIRTILIPSVAVAVIVTMPVYWITVILGTGWKINEDLLDKLNEWYWE